MILSCVWTHFKKGVNDHVFQDYDIFFAANLWSFLLENTKQDFQPSQEASIAKQQMIVGSQIEMRCVEG